MPRKSASRAATTTSFRIGRVRAFLRGRVWYLCYHEGGRRRQPRVGPDRGEARQLAAEVNAQLEVGAPSALGFEPISIAELRQRWLDYHEHVRRSSLQTIGRYRTATAHLINFLRDVRPVRHASDLRPRHAEEFARYLRQLSVAPNGHEHTTKRCLRDTGVKFILETCSTLFNYAQRNRHLPPYAENPFRMMEINRIPIEDPRPIFVFSADEERQFFEACDAWQLPIFLTLLLTGLRPGELTHLLLPEDIDLERGWLLVRNKPELGWQVKTRNERDIPLMPVLVHILRTVVGRRSTGPLFRQRRCQTGYQPPLASRLRDDLSRELALRIRPIEAGSAQMPSRAVRARVARTIWRDLGAIRSETVRNEFMRLTAAVGIPHVTAPKTLRHTFATILQDANVDPLIRNELMGHAPASHSRTGHGLAMTAVYTHTRPETKRRQHEAAFRDRPAVQIAERFLQRAEEMDAPRISR